MKTKTTNEANKTTYTQITQPTQQIRRIIPIQKLTSEHIDQRRAK